MTMNHLDELGSIDYLVVEFHREEASFPGEIAAALRDLVDRELVRVLDLVLVRKDADGSVAGVEVSELDDEELGELRTFEAEVAALLSEEDVAAVAEAIEPGSVAGVVVWENRWSVPFTSAVRRAGGQLVASGRIPLEDIAAALEDEGPDQDLDPDREDGEGV